MNWDVVVAEYLPACGLQVWSSPLVLNTSPIEKWPMEFFTNMHKYTMIISKKIIMIITTLTASLASYNQKMTDCIISITAVTVPNVLLVLRKFSHFCEHD